MQISKLSIEELEKKIESKEITPYEIYQEYMKNIEEKNDELGVYLSVNKFDNAVEYNEKYRIPISVKDNIAISGLPLTASSKILENYISPYNSTIAENLEESGIYVLGKTNMDELAFGFSTHNSEILKTLNPLDKDRIPGGSSGGSAASVASDLAPWSIGSDTGGSVRQPAAFCGVVGFKPSYGLISRYGLISFASSFDQIGTITKNVRDSAYLMNILSVKSEEDKDPNTIVLEKDYLKELDKDLNKKKIGIVRKLIDESSDIVKERVNEAIRKLEDLGFETTDVEIPYLDTIPTLYSILAYAEASANLERLDGVRYGLRKESNSYEDMVLKTRTEGFGIEAKTRIILGSYVLKEENIEKYYFKAAKIRRKIIDELKSIFENVDFLVLPTVNDIATLISDLDKANTRQMDKHTVIANLAGLPAISIPTKTREGELPVGLQIVGKQFEDDLVLALANIYEQNREI